MSFLLSRPDIDTEKRFTFYGVFEKKMLYSKYRNIIRQPRGYGKSPSPLRTGKPFVVHIYHGTTFDRKYDRKYYASRNILIWRSKENF